MITKNMYKNVYSIHIIHNSFKLEASQMPKDYRKDK